MNGEDFYEYMLLSDFERAHPEWRIPGAGCLDPAVPEVYAHRMKIFRRWPSGTILTGSSSISVVGTTWFPTL